MGLAGWLHLDVFHGRDEVGGRQHLIAGPQVANLLAVALLIMPRRPDDREIHVGNDGDYDRGDQAGVAHFAFRSVFDASAAGGVAPLAVSHKARGCVSKSGGVWRDALSCAVSGSPSASSCRAYCSASSGVESSPAACDSSIAPSSRPMVGPGSRLSADMRSLPVSSLGSRWIVSSWVRAIWST